VPWPEEYGLRAKVEHLRQNADRYDLVYVGSSRTYRGLDPHVIDPLLAERGIQVLSFNVGVGGMYAYERDHLLRSVVALRGERLRWIVMESGMYEPRADFGANRWSTRSVHWHDLEGTWLAMRSSLRLDAPWLERLDACWTHLQLFGMRLFNMGQGRRIVLDLLGASGDPLGRALSPAELAEGRGYQALEGLVREDTNAWQRRLAADPQFARALARHVAERNAAPPDLEHLDVEAIRAQLADVRAAGLELIHFLPPGNDGHPEVLALHARGDIPHLLHYNDPAAYPDFFDDDSRYDEVHLSAESAAALSRRVAADLAALLAP
jgi:hypothetical protein